MKLSDKQEEPHRREVARHNNVLKAIEAADKILTTTATSEDELHLMIVLVANAFMRKTTTLLVQKAMKKE
jgi:hypothetical protein